MHASGAHRRAPAVVFAAALALFPSGWTWSAGPMTAAWADDALEVGQETARPELHHVALLDDFAERMLVVEGVLFGKTRGRARVGGKRARVISWKDSSITLRVSRRAPVGGVRAIEVTTRRGLEPAYPLPVVLPGEAQPRNRVACRLGGRSRGIAADSTEFSAGGLEISFERTVVKVLRTWTTTRRERVCGWERKCDGWVSIFGECLGNPGRWDVVWRCRWKTIRERHRKTRTRTWTMRIRVPIDSVDQQSQQLFTAADAASMSAPPIEYSYPDGEVSIAPERDDWWIVVGRDETGVICGQFRSVAPDGRTFSGHFTADPD